MQSFIWSSKQALKSVINRSPQIGNLQIKDKPEENGKFPMLKSQIQVKIEYLEYLQS